MLKLKCMNTSILLVSHYVSFPKKEERKKERNPFFDYQNERS